MSAEVSLRVAGVGHPAAKHAVMRWHYSRTMPAGKLVKLGVFEAGEFIGVVIFSRGANPRIAQPYDLDQTQVCELTRVALTTHVHPVSEILALALRELRRLCPGVRLVVSYADSTHGHHGGIYQAGNWVYTGDITKDRIIVHGKLVHPRTVYGQNPGVGGLLAHLRKTVDPYAHVLPGCAKRRYIYPLDRAIRRRVSKLARPYPPPMTGVPAVGPAEEGSTVTRRAPGAEMQVRPLPSAPPTPTSVGG